MPVYEFSVSAKVTIRMDGENPEKACNNLESLLEDFYMQIPCQGHEIHFGKYPATVWVNDTKPTLKRELPEGVDPTKSPRMTMSEWMKMCMEPVELNEEEAAELDKILASGEARCKIKPKAIPEVSAEEFLGKDLPEASKEDLLKKQTPDS